jgi:hypothetical protein
MSRFTCQQREMICSPDYGISLADRDQKQGTAVVADLWARAFCAPSLKALLPKELPASSKSHSKASGDPRDSCPGASD